MKKRADKRKYSLIILVCIFTFVFLISPLFNLIISSSQVLLSPTEFIGKSEVVITDKKDNSSSTSYFIHVEGIKYEIIYNSIIPEDLVSGEDIQVLGSVNQFTKEISSVSIFNRLTKVNNVIASVQQRGNFNLGEQKTLVVPIYATTLPSITPQEISTKIFDLTNSNSMNSWIKEVSYNRVWLSGTVTNWTQVSIYSCNPNSMREDLIPYLQTNNINIEPYTRLIVILADGMCSSQIDGIANIGIPEFTLGDTKIWLSTSLINGPSNLDNGVIIHEFGHNLGLYHANVWNCGQGNSVGSCSSDNYADQLDIMGGNGHFNAFHKEKIGWFKKDQIVNYNPKQGNYTLEPIETPIGIKMIKIPLAEGTFYSIEYRRPIGYDSFLNSIANWFGPLAFEGALIHLSKEANYGDTQLIDLTPTGHFERAILPVGSTFTDQANGITITTLEATPDYLKINITGSIKCSSGDTLNLDGNCTAKIESEPEDAYLEVNSADNNFNNLRNSQTGAVREKGSFLYIRSEIRPASQSSSLSRSFLSFDTRNIPLSSIISSATLSIAPSYSYFYSTETNPQINFITLIKANPTNPPPLSASDFSKITSTEVIDIREQLIPAIPNPKKDFILNSLGLSSINKTNYTTFALITGRDFMGGSQSDNREDKIYSILSSNHPSTALHPQLKIIYTLSQNTCGNGILDSSSGEQCDDTLSNSNLDQCSNSCTLTYCGDGIAQKPNGKGTGGLLNYGYEECDDGNANDNDYCSNNCIINNNPNICASKNRCEDYGSDSSLCSNDPCSFGGCNMENNLCKGPVCGNNAAEMNEFCDGLISCQNEQGYLGTAECNLQCTNTRACNNLVEKCGDGFINGQEICDEGTQLNGQPNHCNSACTGQTPAVCGNGYLEVNETCDDGNKNNGDNCVYDNGDYPRKWCINNICGDGFFNYLKEECDDKNANDSDYCKNNCKVNPVCDATKCTIKIPSIGLDGFISANSNANFDNLRVLTNGTYVNQYVNQLDTLPLMQLRNAQTSTNSNNQITRVVLSFKTSLIPSLITIQSAKVEILSLVSSASASLSTKNYIKLAKINLQNPPDFSINDYNKFTIISANKTNVTSGSSGVINLSLNNSELSWINKNAWTILGIKGGYDIEGIQNGVDADLKVNFRPGDEKYSPTYPTPQLVITFPAGCGNGYLETGETCEPPGLRSTCLVQPSGKPGNQNCSSTCQWNNCTTNIICGDGICSSLGESCSSCPVDCGRCPQTSKTCFLPDTLIKTNGGEKMIKDVREGDVVMSYNEKDNKYEYSKVTKTFKHNTSSYLVINDKLKVTSNHPMHINSEWKEIGKAKIGDKIKTLNEDEAIFSIKQVYDNVEVYNLEVENNHNYFAEDFLAHNKNMVNSIAIGLPVD